MRVRFAVFWGAVVALAAGEAGSSVSTASVRAPVTCNMMHNTDFWYGIPTSSNVLAAPRWLSLAYAGRRRRCYWPINNPNHTGTWCTEIAQVTSSSPEDCCNLCIKNSSASASAHAGTLNCTGAAYNFGAKKCFLKALAVENVTGHPVKSSDTSFRLVF